MRMRIVWNPEKSEVLRADQSRGSIGFEECLIAIEQGNILDIVPNPSANFPAQKIYVLKIGDYAYGVPFVDDGNTRFLKTLFPSRKFTALYLEKTQDG